ncbi:MAG: class I SAM-dependent methyltransferase [Salibacteraceae bacterium]
MPQHRVPFEGVLNILRFNWHFYVLAAVLLVGILVSTVFLPVEWKPFVLLLAVLGSLPIVVSLLVSWYVYDASSLYQLPWLQGVSFQKALTLNAGFDETTVLLQHQFPFCDLTVADFYNPQQHTEVSIKRARKAYPPQPQTVSVTTTSLPFPDAAFDGILAILSAHEIRDEQERIAFFRELKRSLTPDGRVWVTEHLRDVPNFLAYTLGFFHFHSRATWLHTFHQAGFSIQGELKTTPFITTFVLTADGPSL